MPIEKKDMEKIRDLIKYGTSVPCHGSTKPVYVQATKELYLEVELLRKYIIEKKI